MLQAPGNTSGLAPAVATERDLEAIVALEQGKLIDEMRELNNTALKAGQHTIPYGVIKCYD